jgi:hypothetical protein
MAGGGKGERGRQGNLGLEARRGQHRAEYATGAKSEHPQLSIRIQGGIVILPLVPAAGLHKSQRLNRRTH